MKYGEIWFVSFLESIGHEYKKDRPVLIVQSNQQLRLTNIITVIPLTSNIRNKNKDDILILKNNKNRLYYNSVLKIHHIKTFDRARFIKKIGAADQSILKQVKIYLQKHFDL